MRNFGLLTMVVVGLLSRFLPHPPNFTAIGALAIFSAVHLKPRYLAILLPVGALFVTDWVIGFHNTMLFTYGAWVTAALMISFFFGKFSWTRLSLSSGLLSIWFFILSNFGVWWGGGLYPRSVAGLSECFIAAIPFLGNQLAGDLSYSIAFFAIWQMLDKRVFSPSIPVS